MTDFVEISLAAPGEVDLSRVSRPFANPRNALGAASMEALLGRLEVAAGAPVLIRGSAEAFSAGLNLKEVIAMDVPAMRRFLDLLERTMAALWTYAGPTVACVEGHAIAGGCVITLCCDRRVAARSAKVKIGVNEVALGLQFPPRILRLVADRVPRAQHEEVIYAGKLFDPEGALAAGLVDELADDPYAVAVSRIEALARLPRAAYAATKGTLRRRVIELEAHEEEAFYAAALPVWTSDELKQRLAAALKK